MTENEQIEELESIAYPFVDGCACDQESGSCEFTTCRNCNALNVAKAIYAKGYRKVERGEWIPYGMNMNGTVGNWKCSVCNKSSLKPSDFCGSCGADMRKEQNND